MNDYRMNLKVPWLSFSNKIVRATKGMTLNTHKRVTGGKAAPCSTSMDNNKGPRSRIKPFSQDLLCQRGSFSILDIVL